MEVPRRIVLDTTVLISHLRAAGEPSTVTRLVGKAELATTTINLFELYLGAYKYREVGVNLTAVKGLSSTLKILTVTESAAETGGKVLADLQKAGRDIEIRDILVGAVALEEGFAVATRNVDHFTRIPGLQVVSEDELLTVL